MKKIYFGKNSKSGIPFWQPWGIMGCLGRLLGFLLLLLALLLLLSLFRGCKETVADEPTPIIVDPDWNQPIQGGETVGLPAPEENVMPPFLELEPIRNPENGGATEIFPNLLYVIFDSDANDETFKIFASRFTSLYPAPQHQIEYYNTSSKTAVLSVPEDRREIICENLPEQITEIDFYVVPVEVMTQETEVMPNDPAFADANKSWYFKPIQMYEAWGITQGSSDIIVGIVDSYMDLNHPELAGGRAIYPFSVTKCDANVAPPHGIDESTAGHGTLVTSVAVGNANNHAGSSGIAPKCRFIPVSIGDALNTVTMVEGLLYCIYHGANVVNLSCGSSFSEEILQMPLDEQIAFSEQHGKRQEAMWNYIFNLADKHNVTIVWAAGNENCFGAMDTSKRNSNTIRVSAVDHNLQRADFSNFGNFSNLGIYESTISAPGVDIWGALPDNSYDAWPGTSFSAPIVTGVVALLKSENKNLTTAEIIKILQRTGKPVSNSPEIGNLVQVRDALVKARQTISSADTEN